MSVKRAYYVATIAKFLEEHSESILGTLADSNMFDLVLEQRNAWREEIGILKSALHGFDEGHLLLEYSIPRMGKRIDAVVLFPAVVVPIEFKVGARTVDGYARDQVMDYALDLKYFHKESANALIVPVVVATDASTMPPLVIDLYEDNVASALAANSQTLSTTFELLRTITGPPLDAATWIDSPYQPTPTIIEAAQALYKGHGVTEISRSDATAENLSVTAGEVNRIIDESKAHNRKSICIVTGVPGAGKTLVGLTIANDRHKYEELEHAVFLSGKGPLVQVLQEALARDEYERAKAMGQPIPKNDALRKAKSFIQNIHHFRDDAIQHGQPPIEKVTLFDEAQRSWDDEQLSKFMKAKKGISGFNQSEPEFLIEVMDRHRDWAVIVCLVGEGQEINTGEAGIAAWLDVLGNKFRDWYVHVSPRIYSESFSSNQDIQSLVDKIGPSRVVENNGLHLGVSVRSFRSEKLSAFVETLLNNEPSEARLIFEGLKEVYPIVLTRDIGSARSWVQAQARGTERYGLTASAGARRLRPFSVWIQNKIEPANWFLNDKDDIRSSFGLEETATEFDIQGLELDWTIVCWDGDLRYNGTAFEHHAFKGARWTKVGTAERQIYLKNAYRVLLTRARQGIVIFVPPGSDEDDTRKHEFYDPTYEYLLSIGISEI